MRIMYFMNVDWGWIKQRPHFIAEGLAKDNSVILFYPHTYKKNNGALCKNESAKIKPHKYYNFPFRRRFKIIDKLNSMYLRLFFGLYISFNKPDVIWIAGNPDAASFLSKKNLKKAYYDCMDDYYAMSNSRTMLTNEESLVKHCKSIFVSSESLRKVILDRYKIEPSKTTLVRNGFDGDVLDVECNERKDGEYNLAYIGTISSWFDFDLLNEIINSIDNIKIHIVGPVKPEVASKCKSIEKNSNVLFYGSMEHESLFGFAKKMDCLMMPFIINDIILSVDPVKLYEYINFNKNILCVYYPEIERFRRFVGFYSSKEEAIDRLKEFISCQGVRYSKEDRIDFLHENNWESRLKTIKKIMEQE